MSKRIIALVLVLCLVMAVAACGVSDAASKALSQVTPTSEPQTGLPNPVHESSDYISLLIAAPGIILSDAPETASGVTYSTIDGDPQIAQIQFQYQDHDYTYRAAAVGENQTSDISGVYDPLDQSEQLTTDGGIYTLRYAAGSGVGLATWYYGATKCAYSLYTATGCGAEQHIKDVVDLLLPINITINGQTLGFTTPSPEPAALNVTGNVTGTVVSVGEHDVLVTLENGSTLSFLTNHIDAVAAKAGDTVQISYAGDITDVPEIVTITVTQSAPEAISVSGTVYQYSTDSLFLQTSAGDIYGFHLTNLTAYSGQSKTLKIGNSVTVTYTGDLNNGPIATLIATTAVSTDPEPAKEDEDALKDKRLKGVVTDLNSRQLTVLTGSGNYYTFFKDGTTEHTGKYNLETGCSVRITYDGYASNAPLAKVIQVLAPADPDPVVRTIHGMVSVQAGNALSVQADDGNTYNFLLGAPQISGTGDVGDIVRVTFEDNDGVYNVTSIVYETPIIFAQ